MKFKLFPLAVSLLAPLFLAAVSVAERQNDLQHALKAVDLNGELLYVSTGQQAYSEFINRILADGKKLKPESEIIFRIQRLANTPPCKAIAISSIKSTPGTWLTKQYLYIGKAGMALPGIWNFSSVPDQQLDFMTLPDDTIAAFSVTVPFGQLYGMIKKELSALPQARAALQELEQKAAVRGIDLPKLLNSISGRVKFYIAGSAMHNFRGGIELPDANGSAAAILRKLLKLPPDAQNAQLPIGFAPGTLDFSDRKIRFNMLPRTKEMHGTLAHLPKFRDYAGTVGTRGSSYIVLNISQTLIDTAKNMIPPQIFDLLELSPCSALVVCRRLDDGIISLAAADFPASTIVAKFPVVLGSSIMLPALNSARSKAKQVSCLNNLKQLGLALIMYANDHDGKLPPSGVKGIQLLKQDSYLADSELKVLQCPGSTESAVHSQYIYIGGAIDNLDKLKNPSTIPLAFDRPGNHPKNQVNVLFADGHVQTLTAPNCTTPAQLIGVLNRSYNYPPELLDKLLRETAGN